MPEKSEAPPSVLQRADGGVLVAVRSDGTANRLADLRQASPCRALFPRIVPGEPLRAVLVNTGGGLVEGDRMSYEFVAQPGAHLSVTSQAAEKVYRSIGAVCRQRTQAVVGVRGFVDYRPSETILFDGARLHRLFSASLDRDARLLTAETILFGRVARGERFTHGFLHDGWSVRREGRLAWLDATRLDGDVDAIIRGRFGFDGAVGYATLLYAGPDAPDHLALARSLAEPGSPSLAEPGARIPAEPGARIPAEPGARIPAEPGARSGGATIVNGLLLVRLMDRDEARLRLTAATVGDVLARAITKAIGAECT